MGGVNTKGVGGTPPWGENSVLTLLKHSLLFICKHKKCKIKYQNNYR
jgi:hypothetical protein